MWDCLLLIQRKVKHVQDKMDKILKIYLYNVMDEKLLTLLNCKKHEKVQ